MPQTKNLHETDTLHCNEVRLIGRVSGSPEERELPSGDRIAVIRVVVAREGAPRTPKSPRVDTIECSARTAKARRSVSSWSDGDLVEVRGAVRRWFRRGPQGPTSRYGIEVNGGRRVRAGPRPD